MLSWSWCFCHCSRPDGRNRGSGAAARSRLSVARLERFLSHYVHVGNVGVLAGDSVPVRDRIEEIPVGR